MKKVRKRTFARGLSGILAALVLTFACVMLGGCGEGDNQIKAYTYTDELGGNYRIEFTYEGDAVLKQYQTYTLSFGEIEEGIEDVIRGNAESVAEGYAEIDYINYTYSIKNDTFTEKVTINDIGDHVKEISEMKLIPIEVAEDAEHISLKLVEDALLAGGWTAAE